MCRIVGILNSKEKVTKPLLAKMRDTLSYGGPDSADLYISKNQILGLGHRRLSILDLSEKGTQPFRWNGMIICYNGEVYNFAEVKSRMPEYEFTSGTDTEVILKAFHKWGKDCVHHFRGMFAFAIWEEQKNKLTLCRDRVGVKPLYWYLKDGVFLFASELKAFHEFKEFDKTINQKSVSLFLQQGYIPAPHCIFQYAHKLEPGYWLEIDKRLQPQKTKYWSAKKVFAKSVVNHRSEDEITEELEDKLKESFRLRMVADVPVGMFLSGGVDSTLVTALLQKESPQPLKTFTIGFDHPERDEAPFAKKVAQHIGTDHSEFYCSEKAITDLLPKFAEWYDEPFGDSSGMPTFLVAQLASQQVKVSLSADGADELFGGYAKYIATKKYFKKIKYIPPGIRKGISKAINYVDPAWLDRNRNYFPVLRNYNDLDNKFSKLQNAFQATDEHHFFNSASSFMSPDRVASFIPKHFPRYPKNGLSVSSDQLISYLGMIDIQTYLEGDIMCKVDRATMQHALEGREPFLDHHLIEFAFTIPDHLKINGNTTKYLLRKILYKNVPREIMERPKQGFAAPFGEWMRSILKAEICAIPEDIDFLNCFQLNQHALQEVVSDFMERRRYVNASVIWFFYTLFRWYKRWMK